MEDGCETAPDPPSVPDLFHSNDEASLSLSGSLDSLMKHQQAWRLHYLLWNVFTAVLEPRIGLWIEDGGCPFTAIHSVCLNVCPFCIDSRTNDSLSYHPNFQIDD